MTSSSVILPFALMLINIAIAAAAFVPGFPWWLLCFIWALVNAAAVVAVVLTISAASS